MQSNNIYYGIYPPKYVGSTVYYKDIIIFKVKNDKILDAFYYDINGFKIDKNVSIKDIAYQPSLKTIFNQVKIIDSGILTNSSSRSYWLFNSEKEAFIQKIICFKVLRDYYNNNEIENRKLFDSMIVTDIDNVLNDIKEKEPEYFL